jgi:hypothetical protein
MNIPLIFRSHIRDKARLAVTERTLLSALDKDLPSICDITVLDDGSLFGPDLRGLCRRHEISYKKAGGSSSTINGLMESLKLHPGPVLCCVDDIVFGKGTKDKLSEIWNMVIPRLDKQEVAWGIVGLFMDYPRQVNSLVCGCRIAELPANLVYALTFHFYSTPLKSALLKRWDKILADELPWPACADDIFVNRLLGETGLRYFNTNMDYAQHTGMNLRSFGSDGEAVNSEYQTEYFVGE